LEFGLEGTEFYLGINFFFIFKKIDELGFLKLKKRDLSVIFYFCFFQKMVELEVNLKKN